MTYTIVSRIERYSTILCISDCLALEQQLNKAKVAIPSNLGRTMYGVMDETGMLQYGQVFVQYSPNVRTASEEVITHSGKLKSLA